PGLPQGTPANGGQRGSRPAKLSGDVQPGAVTTREPVDHRLATAAALQMPRGGACGRAWERPLQEPLPHGYGRALLRGVHGSVLSEAVNLVLDLLHEPALDGVHVRHGHLKHAGDLLAGLVVQGGALEDLPVDRAGACPDALGGGAEQMPLAVPVPFFLLSTGRLLV